MIAPHHLVPEVTDAYRALLTAAAPPHLLLPGALEPGAVPALRARLAAAGTERYDLADRARYHWNGTLVVEELWSALAAFASAVTATPLAVRGARWLRYARGDYALVKDDVRTRPAGAPLVELSLDLSDAYTAEAEQVFTLPAAGDALHALSIPQLPGLLAVVPRPPAMTRYDRPLTARAGGAEVVRLRMWLAPVTPPPPGAAAAAPPTAR